MQLLHYKQKTLLGATVSVNAFLTFEGNPVMKLAELQNWQTTSWSKELLIRIELDYPEQLKGKKGSKIADGNVSAYREQWMNLADYFTLIGEFQKHGTEYIRNFPLKAKWNGFGQRSVKR